MTSYDETISQYYSFHKEVKGLKREIEDEIHDINKSSIETFREMNKYFNKKRYYINKKQRKLKTELNSRINKAK